MEVEGGEWWRTGIDGGVCRGYEMCMCAYIACTRVRTVARTCAQRPAPLCVLTYFTHVRSNTRVRLGVSCRVCAANIGPSTHVRVFVCVCVYWCACGV